MLATRAVNIAFRECSCYFLAYMHLRNKIEYARIEFMNRTLYNYETIRKLDPRNHRKLELNLSKEKKGRRGRDIFKIESCLKQG